MAKNIPLLFILLLIVTSTLLTTCQKENNHNDKLQQTINKKETGHKEKKSAEDVIKSKRISDITYKQVMQVMGLALTTIQHGLVQENPELVMQGAKILSEHAAPKTKPWLSIAPEKQEAFKNALPVYDKIFHDKADVIINAAKKKDWQEVNSMLTEFTSACVGCHIAWKPHVIVK